MDIVVNGEIFPIEWVKFVPDSEVVFVKFKPESYEAFKKTLDLHYQAIDISLKENKEEVVLRKALVDSWANLSRRAMICYDYRDGSSGYELDNEFYMDEYMLKYGL